MKNSNALYYQQQLKRPSWAPPSWLFAPVWTILYILIFISFGSVAFLFFEHYVAFAVFLPFLLNSIFNLIYTPIQFGLKNNYLATVDVVLVWATLLWAMIMIYPYVYWVVYLNIPYLLWVTFASVLQITITILNA